AGFEPGHLAEPGRLGRRGPGRHRPLPAAGRAPHVQAARRGDPVQPGPDRGAPLEPAQPLPGRQQRVLHGVLGILHRTEHPVAVHLQFPLVRADEPAERVLVARARQVDQVRRHAAMVAYPCRAPPAAGRFLAVEPPHLVVFSWGFADDEAASRTKHEGGEAGGAGASAMPAGSTRVTVTLAGTGDGGTLLTLRHENLPSEALREGHDVAWNTYLPRLAVRPAVGDPGPDPHAGGRSPG